MVAPVEQANVFRRVDSQMDLKKISGIIKTLGSPLRLSIVLGLLKNLYMYREGLIDDPSCVIKDIYSGLNLSQQDLSYHMKLLLKSKLIRKTTSSKHKTSTRYILCSNIDFLEALFKSVGADISTL